MLMELATVLALESALSLLVQTLQGRRCFVWLQSGTYLCFVSKTPEDVDSV